MIAGRSIIHVPDLREDELYRVGAPAEVAAVQAGFRTALYVPLIKDQEVARRVHHASSRSPAVLG